MSEGLDRRVVVRNAAANLASGAAGAILAVFLPPFLVRLLDRDTFSVWALLLQIGAYTGLLNFGLQTAVGRFVAHAEARGDPQHSDKIVSTALAALGASAVLAMGIMLALATSLPSFFPDIPPALQDDAMVGLLWVGGSLALGLPFAAVSGVFTGIQRNEVAAAIIVLGRLITAGALIAVAAAGYGLVAMARVYAIVNVLTYAAQWAALLWFVPSLKVSTRKVSRGSLRELIDYSTSLTVASFAMLLVSGLDLALVARFDFPAVGAFAIGAGLANLLQGAQTVVMNAFLPVAAGMDARGDRHALIRLLLRTTRWNLLSLGVALGIFALIGRAVLTTYVGENYVAQVTTILSVLLLAAVVRLSMVPYNIVAIGTGDHRRIILGPLAEGVCNLLASTILGLRYGAIGVAWGTVVGGLVGVAFHLGHNLPRSARLGLRLDTFAAEAFIPAVVAVMPLIVVAALQGAGFLRSEGIPSIGVAAAAIAFLFLGWRVTLLSGERESIIARLKPR